MSTYRAYFATSHWVQELSSFFVGRMKRDVPLSWGASSPFQQRAMTLEVGYAAFPHFLNQTKTTLCRGYCPDLDSGRHRIDTMFWSVQTCNKQGRCEVGNNIAMRFVSI